MTLSSSLKKSLEVPCGLELLYCSGFTDESLASEKLSDSLKRLERRVGFPYRSISYDVSFLPLGLTISKIYPGFSLAWFFSLTISVVWELKDNRSNQHRVFGGIWLHVYTEHIPYLQMSRTRSTSCCQRTEGTINATHFYLQDAIKCRTLLIKQLFREKKTFYIRCTYH